MPAEIQPMPVPAQITVEQCQFPHGLQVRLGINDVTGWKYVFMSPEAAKTIGSQLHAAGSAGNLIVPPGTRMAMEEPEPPAEPAEEEPVGGGLSLPPGTTHRPNRAERRQAEREAKRAA